MREIAYLVTELNLGPSLGLDGLDDLTPTPNDGPSGCRWDRKLELHIVNIRALHIRYKYKPVAAPLRAQARHALDCSGHGR